MLLSMARRIFQFDAEDEALFAQLEEKLKAEVGASNSAIAVIRWAMRIAVKLKAKGKANG